MNPPIDREPAAVNRLTSVQKLIELSEAVLSYEQLLASTSQGVTRPLASLLLLVEALRTRIREAREPPSVDGVCAVLDAIAGLARRIEEVVDQQRGAISRVPASEGPGSQVAVKPRLSQSRALARDRQLHDGSLVHVIGVVSTEPKRRPSRPLDTLVAHEMTWDAAAERSGSGDETQPAVWCERQNRSVGFQTCRSCERFARVDVHEAGYVMMCRSLDEGLVPEPLP